MKNYLSGGGGRKKIGKNTRRVRRKINKTIRRGGDIIRLSYYPGFGTGMRSDIHIQTEKPTRGWLASLKDMENDITEFFRGVLATDEQREEKKKKTSIYMLKQQTQPEVADIKQKTKTPICLSDKEAASKAPNKKESSSEEKI